MRIYQYNNFHNNDHDMYCMGLFYIFHMQVVLLLLSLLLLIGLYDIFDDDYHSMFILITAACEFTFDKCDFEVKCWAAITNVRR